MEYTHRVIQPIRAYISAPLVKFSIEWSCYFRKHVFNRKTTILFQNCEFDYNNCVEKQIIKNKTYLYYVLYTRKVLNAFKIIVAVFIWNKYIYHFTKIR